METSPKLKNLSIRSCLTLMIAFFAVALLLGAAGRRLTSAVAGF
ncbi:MAG TPA: hypothetical protein VF573_05600 [Paraburkholderia sp.]